MKVFIIVSIILVIIDIVIAVSKLTKMSKRSFHCILWGTISILFAIGFSKILTVKDAMLASKIILVIGIALGFILFILSYENYRKYASKIVNPELVFLIKFAKRLCKECPEESKVEKTVRYAKRISDLSKKYVNSIMDEDQETFTETSKLITNETDWLTENGIIHGEDLEIQNLEKIYELI